VTDFGTQFNRNAKGERGK